MSKKKRPSQRTRSLTRPHDIERWLERAGQQLLAADYAAAMATLQRVVRAPIASSHQQAVAYDCLGAVYMQLQQHEEAYAAVSAAIALAPDSALSWYNLGITARYTTRFGQSLRAFEHAARLDTNGILAAELAEALPLARSIVEQELVLRGADFGLDQLITQEEVFQSAVNVMAQHRWAEAEALFRQSIALGDGLPQPWGNLGICLLMQRQFDAAEAALRRALDIDPGYSIARQNLAGLPAIRASGHLPALHINKTFDGKPARGGVTFLTVNDA